MPKTGTGRRGRNIHLEIPSTVAHYYVQTFTETRTLFIVIGATFLFPNHGPVTRPFNLFKWLDTKKLLVFLLHTLSEP